MENADTDYVSSDLTDENKVLVIDDQPGIVRLITRFLVQSGYDVDSAYSGYEAFDIIKKKTEFDLIILDIMMPKMNGYEVCRKLRERYSLFELPILILTAKNMSDDIVEGFEAGANDYISKPFDSNELIARVKTLIRLKKLTQANSVLQEAIELKNRFHSMTIHDLKNPLTSILLLSNMIKSDMEQNSEHLKSMSYIIESAEMMLSLVESFLEATMIETGRIVLNREYTDFRNIITNVIRKNQQLAEKKNQPIDLEVVGNGPFRLFADPVRLEEIVDNLLSNAIKYSPLNKPVNLKLCSTIKCENQKLVRLEIKDHGPGFTTEDKKNMFGKFKKLTAKPTAGESSSGLGLCIAKQLTEMHDGKLWVESIEGQGSTFCLELVRV
jgi:signal transduction histidine kinase